jgi:hypothetical protein
MVEVQWNSRGPLMRSGRITITSTGDLSGKVGHRYLATSVVLDNVGTLLGCPNSLPDSMAKYAQEGSRITSLG